MITKKVMCNKKRSLFWVIYKQAHISPSGYLEYLSGHLSICISTSTFMSRARPCKYVMRKEKKWSLDYQRTTDDWHGH